jgi:carbonic anhydrase/acetyltransferase-like protein (isoleucine patch superfamily)
VIRSLGEHVPQVHPTAFVHERAEVIGKVRIGPKASIWPGAVLRGDIEEIVIGEGSNVQDNAVIHTDHGMPTVVGDGVTVGHAAILHGCRVGNGALVGMGSILLNGSVVEDECLVGAGALLAPGMRVPKGHLALGSPAKAVRPLKREEVDGIRKNGQNYLTYAESHRRDSRTVG